MAAGDSYRLFARYQAGEDDAATEIFDRYAQRLVALARSRLSTRMGQRVDPEDIVQSAFRSFFVNARGDAYAFRQSGDLWRLLVQITLHKLYGQVERHCAKRRSIVREEAAGESNAYAATLEPTPVEVLALVEQLHLIMRQLSAAQQIVIAERLNGLEIDQIAASLGKSARTVRRILAETQQQIEHQLAGAVDPHGGSGASESALAVDRRVALSADSYVLEKLLGAGGMGKVYRARKRESGNKVAVKSLRKLHQSDPRAVELFVQEAQILSTLDHPSIVRFHGLGRFPGGGLFIVMDYVEGSNLQDRLRSGPFELQQALMVVHQVAGAVAHAHEHGVVHADLKPANVLIDEANRAVVTDFGFSRIIVADGASNYLHVGGTAGFMAPEVLRLGQPPTIAADIFGLGALLWALLTGSSPEGVASPDRDDAALALVSPICRKCMADDPRERYPNAGELLIELAKVMD